MEKSSTFVKWFSKKSYNISNIEKVIHILTSLVIFWIGVWKIRNDLEHVLSKSSYNSDIWVEIIESLDILVFISMVMVVNLENIVKVRNKCTEMENWNAAQSFEIYRVVFMLNLFLYGCLVFIIVCQHILANNQKDFIQFFISLITQFYLLYTELEFIKVVTEIMTYFGRINYLLEELLVEPRPIWWIGYEKGNKIYHLEDCINLHWSVCKYVAKINHEFSLRLLFIIICIFYKLMFIPYLSSLNLIKAYSENLMKELLHAGLLMFHFAELLVLACFADWANCEADKTRFILCEYIEFQSKYQEIDSVETKLNYLLVHKAELKIFSLFKLNKPFVLAMFGAVVTYMVIFIQLQDALNISQISTSVKK